MARFSLPGIRQPSTQNNKQKSCNSSVTSYLKSPPPPPPHSSSQTTLFDISEHFVNTRQPRNGGKRVINESSRKIKQVVGRSKTCATLVLMREMGGKRWRRITRLMPDKRLTKIQNFTIFQNFFLVMYM